MALTSAQQASKLFKKSLGVGETLTTKEFFSETLYPGNSNILPSQIWAEADLIPNTAPSLPDLGESGVVKYYSKLSIPVAPGSTNLAYYNVNLKDAIPFNYGDGTSYNYTLYKSDGITQIPFGAPGGDWIVDTSAGLITWYGSLPSGVSDVNPPKISFWRYIGEKGITSTGLTSGIHVHTAVRLSTATGETIANYNTSTSGYTSIPSSIDGISSATFVEGDRILIKNQTDAKQNGLFVVSGTTLVRADDHNGAPIGEVAVGDYVFTMSGITNSYTGWALGSTSGNPQKIIPGVDTQVWEFFSASQSYTADGRALQLFGSQFKVVLDESDQLSSGLEQNTTAGLRIKPALLSTIDSLTGLTSDLSTEISQRVSADSSLTTSINGLTGLTSELSTEISQRVSADASLSTSINGLTGLTSELSTEISQRVSADSSLETAITSASPSGITSAITSLDSALSTEYSQRISVDSSLTTSINGLTGLTSELSTEISQRVSADASLEYSIDNLSGVTAGTAGSGLTFDVPTQSLNVNVDNWTIKVVQNELRTPLLFIQTDKLTNIISGTTGVTNIVLTHTPVGQVSAYINGIEYLVSTTGTTALPEMPFYFEHDPSSVVAGDILKFDATVAGFGLSSGTDLIIAKYHFIDETIY